MRRHGLGLALLIGAATASSAQTEPGPSAGAWIELDAAGAITSLRWDRPSQQLSEAVLGAIESRLRELDWTPAAAHTQARTFGTSVDLETGFEMRGERAVLHIEQIRLGVAYAKLKPPRYPTEAVRHRRQADLLAKVDVSAEGRPVSIEVLRSSAGQEAFETAVRDAIKQWRFQTETVDGQPVAGSVHVPIRFSMHCQRGEVGFELRSEPTATVMSVDHAGQTANADLIEISASRSMRGAKPCEASDAGG